MDDSIAEASSRVERIYTALERERRNNEQQLRVRTVISLLLYPIHFFRFKHFFLNILLSIFDRNSD